MVAAAKRNLKPVTLELGGKSPLIIMDDTDIEQVANLAHTTVFYNIVWTIQGCTNQLLGSSTDQTNYYLIGMAGTSMLCRIQDICSRGHLR